MRWPQVRDAGCPPVLPHPPKRQTPQRWLDQRGKRKHKENFDSNTQRTVWDYRYGSIRSQMDTRIFRCPMFSKAPFFESRAQHAIPVLREQALREVFSIPRGGSMPKVKVRDLRKNPKLRAFLAKALRTQKKRAETREKNWLDRQIFGSK